MQYSIPENKILELLEKQLSHFFFLSDEERACLLSAYPFVMKRVEKNFAASTNKYFNRGNDTYFNPYHSGQWLIFLYFISYELAHPSDQREANTLLSDRVYYLNKIMNGCDLFYEVKLPDIFGVEHPVGTVIGKGTIGEGFFFYQGCVVGASSDNIYPIIGKNCKMWAHSKIIGKCHIGDNVSLGAGCLIKDCDIPSNSVVFGESPNIVIKQKKHD